MGKNKELAKNTLVFGIGTIGSKLMQFLLVPIYTIYLTSEEFSASDLIVSTVFLLSPLLTIGIGNGILRFVIDKPGNQGPVLKLCVYIVFGSTLLLFLLMPFINKISVFQGYGYLVPALFFVYSLKNILAQFCKSIEKNMLYSIDGIVSAVLLTLFSILYIVVFKLGIFGYVLATITALSLSIFLLSFKCGVFKVLKKAQINISLSKEVIRYAFPLMPNEISWWIIQMSNRYILVFFCGAMINGIFSMAYKLPGVFNLVVSIFIQAFGITAIKECNQNNLKEGKIDGSYFEKIFEKYCAITFISVNLIILISKPMSILFLKNEFFEAWKYVPLLLCAYAIGNLQSFYGSIYGGLKKTGLVFFSTLLGAIACIVLNFILVPRYAAFGACIAAILCYFVIYISRLLGLKKVLFMQHFFIKNFASILITIIVGVTYILEYVYLSCVSVVFILFLYRKNCGEMLHAFLKLIKKSCKQSL